MTPSVNTHYIFSINPLIHCLFSAQRGKADKKFHFSLDESNLIALDPILHHLHCKAIFSGPVLTGGMIAVTLSNFNIYIDII